MELSGDKIFRCVVTARAGKLLDCKTASVVFPAHDGQTGILYNHMPLFCRLGLGIMEVKGLPSDTDIRAADSFLLIDGGVALIGSNLLTVIAQDAIYLHGVKPERVEKMLEKAGTKLARGTYTVQQRRHETEKLSLLIKLAQMSAHPK